MGEVCRGDAENLRGTGRMMKIAIDGRALTVLKTGGGGYTYHLLKKLRERDEDNHYILCAHKPIRFASDAANLDVRINRFPLGILWQQIGLPHILMKERVDLFHSPLFTIPFCLPCPAVITIFDLTPLLFPQFHHWKVRLSLKHTMGLSARRAGKVIAISESTRRDILRYLSVDESKVVVIYPGVSSSFHPGDSAGSEQTRRKYAGGAKYILHVGTLEPRKNLGFLIDVYDLLRKRESFRNLHLVLAGGKGWGYENLFRKVAELGIEDKVHFAGYVGSDELPRLYRAAEALVFPSLYEGFGLPVLEAMASGLPVVVSSNSSLPEIVGDAGRLIKGWNAEEWAGVIHGVIIDGQLRERAISKGIVQAQKFSWEKCADEVLKVYAEAVR
jgi:glycosyltransferase involved in cell wall biosynthesis